LAIYKTVLSLLTIFPLNLQTITITLDVVKWMLGGNKAQKIFLKRNSQNGNREAANNDTYYKITRIATVCSVDIPYTLHWPGAQARWYIGIYTPPNGTYRSHLSYTVTVTLQ